MTKGPNAPLLDGCPKAFYATRSLRLALRRIALCTSVDRLPALGAPEPFGWIAIPTTKTFAFDARPWLILSGWSSGWFLLRRLTACSKSKPYH
jgi:hypothetical protein